MHQKFKILFLLLIILGFGLVNATAKDTNKLPQITLGFASWPGFDIVYYAEAKKLFQKHGISVKIIKYPDQESAAKAFENKEVDVGMFSAFDALKLKNTGDFSVVFVTNISDGADGILAHNNIKSIKDLKSKRVSAQMGTVNELILLEALDKHGMSLKDIQLVNVKNEEAVRMLVAKELDAATIWEPELSSTSVKIRGNIIYTTEDLESLVVDLCLVNNKTLKEKKETIKRFVDVWFEIMNTLQKQPQEVFEVVGDKIHNDYFGLDYAGLQAGVLKLNQEMFLKNKLYKTLHKIDELIKSDLKDNFPRIENSFIKKQVK